MLSKGPKGLCVTWGFFLALFILAYLTGCSAPKASGLKLDVEGVNSVRFVEVAGDVQMARAGADQWFGATAGMQLDLQDSLETHEGSQADLDVDADKHVLVGESVRMVIEKLLSTVGTSKASALRVDTGAIYVRIQKKLGDGESFEVITPTCVMGVRGTHFVVSVLEGATDIAVLDGELDAKLLVEGTTEPEAALNFTVSAGDHLRVPQGAKKVEDLIRVQLKKEALPVFVLKHLQEEDNRVGLPEDYGVGLNEAIAASSMREKPYAMGAAVALEPPVPVVPAVPTETGGSDRFVDQASGHTYMRIDAVTSFEDAQDQVRALGNGAYLMTIGSKEEQALAEKLISQGKKTFYLIGLVQRPGSGEPGSGFEWVTGEPLNFERWHREEGVQTEPNNAGAGGLAEDYVTLVNGGTWPRGDWNDQNLEGIQGMYGLLCEWDGVEKTEVEVKGQALFEAENLDYADFLKYDLGDAIEQVTDDLGVDLKTVDGNEIKWLYRRGEMLMTFVSREGRIVAMVQRNFEKTVVKLRLSEISVRGKITGQTSVEGVRAVMGSEGTLESKLLMENGDRVSAWAYVDGSGARYILTFNETAKTISHAFQINK